MAPGGDCGDDGLMPDDNSLFSAAGGRLEAAAEVAEVSDDTLERLRLPKSVLKVSIPVRMDDGVAADLRRLPGALRRHARARPRAASASTPT